MESIRTLWKVSGQCGKFLDSLAGENTDSLESFPKDWKVSGQSGKFPDSFVIFGQFSDSQERFTYFFYVVKAIYALLASMSRNENLRTSSGKFLRVKVCRPES